MVRLKHRYLLVHILYPPTSTSTSTNGSSSTTTAGIQHGKPANPTTAGTSPLPDVIHFHRPSSDALTPGLLIRLIRSEIAALFGDYGVGATASRLTVKYFSPATSTFILRVTRENYRLVWAALSFITALPPENCPCVLRVGRVSGTIRKAEEEAVRCAREIGVRARRAAALGTTDGGGGGDIALRRLVMEELEDELAEVGGSRGEILVDGSDEEDEEDDDDDEED